MARNKARVQLALYARPKHPGTYHYALFIAPKSGQVPLIKHHAKNTMMINESGEAVQPWRYERIVVNDVHDETRLLVRVVVAKVVTSDEMLQQTVNDTPVDAPGADLFSCLTWIEDVYERLRTRSALSANAESWNIVHQKALGYLDQKQKAGRWNGSWPHDAEVPLFDLLTGKEVHD